MCTWKRDLLSIVSSVQLMLLRVYCEMTSLLPLTCQITNLVLPSKDYRSTIKEVTDFNPNWQQKGFFLFMTQPDFIQIPQPVLTDTNLQLSDKIVFGYIYWMTKLALMKCIASNGTLAELCGVTERAIQLSLNRLESQGYIKRIFSGQGNHNRTEIKCCISYGKVRTTVRGGTNHSSFEVRTTVRHTNKREEDNLSFSLDKKNKPPKKQAQSSDIAKLSDYPELKPELDSFIEARQAMHKPLTPRALQLIVDKLRVWHPNDPKSQRQCLDNATAGGYTMPVALKGVKPEAPSVNIGRLLHPEKYAV